MLNEEKKQKSNAEVAGRREFTLLAGESGVVLSQFILFLQQKSIWPCHLFIGDDPRPLEANELNKLKDEFKAMLAD